MSDSPVYEFELDDIDGETHRYTVTKQHDPLAGGLRLVQGVVRSAAEPIAVVVNANATTLIQFVIRRGQEGKAIEGKDLLAAFDDDVDELADVDFDLPGVADAFFSALERMDLETVLPKLFKHTNRDNAELSKESTFDSAYRGNYQEMAWAAYEVARYNGFFGSLATRTDSTEGES